MAFTMYPKYHNATPSLFLKGRVLNEVNTGIFRILTDENVFIEAYLAASCLIAPTHTSEVLLAAHNQQYYILAVLTKASPHLNLEAKSIMLNSETLKIQNKVTEIEASSLHTVTAEVISQKADKILLN